MQSHDQLTESFSGHNFIKLFKSASHPMRGKYGIICSLKSAYNHLKRASLVWISARSKHPGADFEAQESFKKKLENT